MTMLCSIEILSFGLLSQYLRSVLAAPATRAALGRNTTASLSLPHQLFIPPDPLVYHIGDGPLYITFREFEERLDTNDAALVIYVD